MEHKFEWNKETKELTEVRTGTELVDSKNKKLDGRFVNTTIYPESTVRDLVVELERQIEDFGKQHGVMKKTIQVLEKQNKPVDKVFFDKFKACMSKMGIVKQEEAMENNKNSCDQVSEQLKKLADAMGDDFV